MSPEFFAHPLCLQRFEQALKLFKGGRGLVLLPSLLRPVIYQLHLGDFPYVFPSDGSPIGGRQKAWSEVANALLHPLTNAANQVAIAKRHEEHTADAPPEQIPTIMTPIAKGPR